MAMGKFYRVFEKVRHPEPYSIIVEHRNYNEALLFESEAVAVLTTNETESLKAQYKRISEAYGCLGVLHSNYGDTVMSYLAVVTACVSVGKIYDSEIFRITQAQLIPLHYSQPSIDERINEVKKVLNSGTFYFSRSLAGHQSLDITSSIQRSFTSRQPDDRFFWNRMLFTHLTRFNVDTNKWLIKMVCGSVEMRTVYGGSKQARAVLFSRLSCERAGTRFIVRGTDDDGHVANFVETEQIIYLDNEVTTHIQIRGSLPLFWEQPGIQVGSHKIRMSRGFEVSAPAFDRHMKKLKKLYGRNVVVNLLGSSLVGSKEGEGNLSTLFQQHQEGLHKDIPHIIYDYHQECRGGNVKNLSKLLEKTGKYLDEFSLFHAAGNNVFQTQSGVLRTNCLDCLDRTNCVQTFFGLEILRKQLALLKLDEKSQIISRFEEVFRQMWINNGNEISKIYAGTGAIQGNSKLLDGARSAARTIQNNLLDSSKQEGIDVLLLGSSSSAELPDKLRLLLPPGLSHASREFLQGICNRKNDFLRTKKIRVSIGTYNVNGGKHFRSVVYKDLSLTDWLLDAPKNSLTADPRKCDEHPIDIFAIGFEEIVDLNASNIMAASSENAKLWADELQKVISRDNEYVLVTYQQLVGVCLYIFIRPVYAPFLKDVSIDCVKTGLGGATGNKGAVAIRIVLFATSYCFICSHFAAGQSQVAERNADYHEITKRISFPLGRTLYDHDYIFWCGDFNYRIDYDKEETKELIKKGELSTLLEHDQLRVQQDSGNVFQGFIEGPIDFPPTYKYDIFSDDFDTSEKLRQPAWTDRVLWKRQRFFADDQNDWNDGELIYYGRAELKQSDHRPVIAIIDVDNDYIVEENRAAVIKEIMQHVGPSDGTIILQFQDSSMDENSVDEFFMENLVQHLSQFGEILLIRSIGDTILVIFSSGQSALRAVEEDVINVSGHLLNVRLHTQDWLDRLINELHLTELE